MVLADDRKGVFSHWLFYQYSFNAVVRCIVFFQSGIRIHCGMLWNSVTEVISKKRFAWPKWAAEGAFVSPWNLQLPHCVYRIYQMVTPNALQNVRLKFLSSSKLCEKYAFFFALERNPQKWKSQLLVHMVLRPKCK